MKKKSDLFSSVWSTLIAPILVGIVLAIFADRVVIQLTGFQLSLGLTILMTLIFFIVIVVSFFLGIGSILYALVTIFTNSKLPLMYRMASYLYLEVIFGHIADQ